MKEQQICSYRLSGFRPVLADNTENFKRFVQIKKKFEKDDLYRLFAIPKIDIAQGWAYWFTEWEGTPVSLGTLDEIEREKHLTYLKYQVDFLFEECRRYQEVDEEYRGLYAVLEKCIEIPDFSNIYMINSPNGERHYVLTMWGFISDEFNAQSGLIRKIIPKNYKRLNINVKYRTGHQAPGEKIAFEYSGGMREFVSNAEGLIVLEDVLLDSSVIAYQPTADGQKAHIVTFNFTGQPEETIVITGYAPMRFVVKDKDGNLKPSEKFVLTWDGKSTEFISDASGEFRIGSLEIFTEVSARHLPADGKKGDVYPFRCLKNHDPYIIVLGAPEVVVPQKPTRIKLVNWRNKIIPQQELHFNYLDKQESRITNEEGRTELESLAPKTKIGIKTKWKKRNYRKKIVINPKKDEYIVKLGNRNLWWLLLLLLLVPFLLLIPLKKDVAVRVVDAKEGTGIAGAYARLCTHERYLFDFSSGRWDSDRMACMEDSTDLTGRVLFKDVRYSVYQWLFFGWESGIVYASSDCYAADSVSRLFSLLVKVPETEVALKALSTDLDFLIINRDNDEPLPGADVKIRAVGGTTTQEGKSGVDGKIVGKDLPLCGDVEVVASCPGYYPDSLKGTVSQIINLIEKRTLKLKPVTRSITFYVKNLKTKQPLPGATLKLIVDGRVVQETQSNTNGAVSMVGEATFEKVHIIKMIRVDASKMDFYDTTKSGNAGDFANGSKEMRTIYMRPKDKPCDIRIVDANTGAPISGAQAVLTKSDGTTKTEFSNSQGVVQFAGLDSDDRISIVASKEPDYQPNSSKINNKLVSDLFNGSQSDRDIPLKPKAPPALPCQTVSIGENIRGYDKTMEYDMVKDNGEFVFDYFTDFQRDAIFIYCGSRLVWSYDGATKRDTPTVRIRFDTRIIKVRVKGDSRWWYKVNCPD